MLTRRFFIGGVVSSGITGWPALAQAGAAAKGDGLLRLFILGNHCVLKEIGRDRAAKRSAPAFAAGEAVAVATIPAKDEKDFVRIELKFPAARAVDGCRVNEYEVTAVLVEDDVELVQAQRRMLSPDHYRPVSGLVKDVSFAFAQEDLPLRGRYRFEVRPIECFGKKGNKIVSSLTVI